MDWAWVGPRLDVRELFPLERRELQQELADLDGQQWANPTFLNRVNDQFVQAARRASPRVLLEMIGDLGPRLDAVWAGLDLDQIGDRTVFWADPDLPAPAWLDVAREFSEFWIHHQQIHDAVTRPTTRAVGGPASGPVGGPHTEVDRLASAVTGPAVIWTAHRQATTRALTLTDTPNPQARLRLSADVPWRVATRGITPEQAARHATISGDAGLARTALQLVSIIR